MIGEGPMPSTTRNMLKILYDRKCGAVVMLSDLVENGMVQNLKNDICMVKGQHCNKLGVVYVY